MVQELRAMHPAPDGFDVLDQERFLVPRGVGLLFALVDEREVLRKRIVIRSEEGGPADQLLGFSQDESDPLVLLRRKKRTSGPSVRPPFFWASPPDLQSIVAHR